MTPQKMTPKSGQITFFRSLCLLKLGEGEGALQDVQMAINAGYPEENR